MAEASDAATSTPQRVIAAAIDSFGARGYDAVSLDSIAEECSVRKQTVLYHFGSKDALFGACIDTAAADLTTLIESEIDDRQGWDAVEAVVGAVFSVAIRRPELLGLVREVLRLGGVWSEQTSSALKPIVDRARLFLEAEMAAGRFRQCDSRLLLVSAYSTVMGVATEVEVLRAVGIEPTMRAAIERRQELLGFLRAALVESPAAS